MTHPAVSHTSSQDRLLAKVDAVIAENMGSRSVDTGASENMGSRTSSPEAIDILALAEVAGPAH